MVGGLGNDSPQAKKKAKGSIAERRPTHSDTFVFSISYKTESGQEERFVPTSIWLGSLI